MTEEIRTKEGSEEIEKNEEIEGKESGIEEETGRRTKSTQAKNQTGQMRKKKAMQMRKREKAGRLFVLGLGICACVLGCLCGNGYLERQGCRWKRCKGSAAG